MSYPTADTVVYPVYCYQNFSREIFSIGCNTQLFLSFSALFTCIPICIILKRQFQRSPRNRLKILVMSLLLFLELLVFVHYFFILGDKTTFPLITAQDLLCSTVQALICYLYCKRTSRLLDNPKTMTRVLQVVGVASIALYVVIIAISSKKNHQDKGKGIYSSCKTRHYVILSTIQASVIVIFFIVACVILNKINHYTPKSELEQRLHDQNKHKYKKHLIICLVTLLVVMIVTNVYDLALYFGNNTGCTRLFTDPDDWWLNQAIWFTQRGITDVFWIYPFLFLMWVPSRSKNSFENQIQSNPNGSYIIHTKEDNDDDSSSSSEEQVAEPLGSKEQNELLLSQEYENRLSNSKRNQMIQLHVQRQRESNQMQSHSSINEAGDDDQHFPKVDNSISSFSSITTI